jgi:hypothetical protein
MPRYFFHVDNGESHTDAEGTELSGLDAAREHAVSYFADILRDSTRSIWDSGDMAMRVTDESGLVFFTLHFAAVVAAAGGHGSSPALPRSV